jgi:PAS domain S-box-containing protein
MNKKIKILHLEDSLNDSELIRSLIESGGIGYDYFLADNEKDYLNILLKENIDLILADYSLPDYNGNEALKVAREKYSHIPFIFVSGTIGEDAAINTLLNGAKDYVLKNKLERLVPAITRAWHESELKVMNKQAEEKLKNSEEIFRFLAEYSPDMIFIIIKNKIYYVNLLCEKKLGYTKEELYAPDFDFVSLVAPEHQKIFNETLLITASGKEVKPFEFLMTSKDGQVLYTMVNSKNIRIGKENAILGVIMDISEQKWAEEILKQKATQIEHFNSLMVDRELKMAELKKEVNRLLEKLGEEPKYNVFGNS